MAEAAAATWKGNDLYCTGSWTARQLGDLAGMHAGFECPGSRLIVDVSEVLRMDSAGAWLLYGIMEKLRSDDKTVDLRGADTRMSSLLEVVAGNAALMLSPPQLVPPSLIENVGRHVHGQWDDYTAFLNFVGRTAAAIGRAMLQPRRIRFSLIAREMETAGLNALPIVGLLSFLVGVVIAYQGGVVLQDYGASIYIADIVGLSTVRELAPLITAIIVAGRTGSAYTAQIGTMMVTDEVDALRSIGIPPLEMLVLPKVLALVIALPLLTVFADLLGLLGGLVMSNSMLGLNSVTYMNRLAEALTLDSYLSGIGKAPVFASIIATVGCFQGFQVSGSAESVGRQTTISVVQSIFLVLIVDAVFSVAFSKLGI